METQFNEMEFITADDINIFPKDDVTARHANEIASQHNQLVMLKRSQTKPRFLNVWNNLTEIEKRDIVFKHQQINSFYDEHLEDLGDICITFVRDMKGVVGENGHIMLSNGCVLINNMSFTEEEKQSYRNEIDEELVEEENNIWLELDNTMRRHHPEWYAEPTNL